MIDVPVYNMTGEQTGAVQIDEAVLGGRVRYALLKQAIVMWTANQRQGSARTKSRSSSLCPTRWKEYGGIGSIGCGHLRWSSGSGIRPNSTLQRAGTRAARPGR